MGEEKNTWGEKLWLIAYKDEKKRTPDEKFLLDFTRFVTRMSEDTLKTIQEVCQEVLDNRDIARKNFPCW